MILSVYEHSLQSVAGERTALVVTPQTRVRVGRARLGELRRGRGGGSDLDRELLDHVRRHGGDDKLVVVRGRSPSGAGSWRFAEGLSEAEQRELGYLLVADELPLYRRLVAAGVFALVHVEWGRAEVAAYRQGVERLLSELEESSVPEVEADPAQVAVARADRFLLRHLTHYYEDGFEEVVRSVLIAHLAQFEERIPHFRAMVAALPPDAVA